MTNRIFIAMRCRECDTLLGAKVYPNAGQSTDEYYCFECAFSFAMVNEVIGTKHCQSVKQFLRACGVKDRLDQLMQTGDARFVRWLSKIELWYREQRNVTSETEAD